MAEPTPRDLWLQAGGGTPKYSAERYRELLTDHGMLIPIPPGATPEPLPCGWPAAGSRDVRTPRRDPERGDGNV